MEPTENYERLARIEQYLESLVREFRDFKDKGHPDCGIREVRIKTLEKHIEEIKKYIELDKELAAEIKPFKKDIETIKGDVEAHKQLAVEVKSLRKVTMWAFGIITSIGAIYPHIIKIFH